MNTGTWKEVIDEEFVGVCGGEVGAHIECDTAEGHSFEECGEVIPGVFFVADGVRFGELEGFIKEQCEGFVFFAAQDFVPGFVEAFGIGIDI